MCVKRWIRLSHAGKLRSERAEVTDETPLRLSFKDVAGSITGKQVSLILFWLILLLGSVLRILWVAAVDTAPVSDFYLYHAGALSIASGDGFRIYGSLSAYEPIGYPAFLAFLYYIAGPDILAPKIANILFSIAIMTVTYLVGKAVFSHGAALIAMLMLALSPRNISYTSVLSTEITFTLLFLLLTLLLLKKYRGVAANILIGIMTGILALIKPYMLIYQFVILILDFIINRDVRRSVKRFIIANVVMALVICPWMIRNYTVFKEFIPVSTNGGYNLYINNNPYANGAWQDPFKFPGSPLAAYKNSTNDFWDEVKVDKLGKKLAFQWIRENPLQFLRLGLIKLYRTFILADDTYWATSQLTDGSSFKYGTQVYDILQIAYKSTLFLAGFYFLVLLAKKITGKSLSRYHWIIFINLAFFSAIVFVFEGQPRYAFPVLPFFTLMAGYAMTAFRKND